MNIVCLTCILVGILADHSDAKRKRKFEGDFEFADENELKTVKPNERRQWFPSPTSELCRPLNCKKKEICYLEDSSTAVCIPKKQLLKDGNVIYSGLERSNKQNQNQESKYEDDDVFYDAEDNFSDDSEDASDLANCKPCPVVKPIFLCGVDNRTYSSLCRLDYHNCLHRTSVKVACKGFCPCRVENETLLKKQRQSERANSFMNKYKATLVNNKLYEGKSSNSPVKSDAYTFSPQDFKYENKHYKYIKYIKHKKDNFLEEKELFHNHNEVTDNKRKNTTYNHLNPLLIECSAANLQTMGNRLLDWFSVVMSDSANRRRKHFKSKVPFLPLCKNEVRWMFQHLDLNEDAQLSVSELYDLEHDKNEACLKPFLQNCDADGNSNITPAEWCNCFQRTERPCAAVKRKIVHDMLGVFVPDCDNHGYYKPVQCYGAIGMCWCVDKHGVEFANTRTSSKPNCEYILNKSKTVAKYPNGNVDDEDGDDDVDQDMEGSADRPVDY